MAFSVCVRFSDYGTVR
ncbi:hypothetical protein M2G45_22400 [Vibrio vulnificus]|nr:MULTISPECIES: hypothetical protein [Vibrio]MCU8461629.1 hypothetical protein [Vibrio vulnificus]MCU8566870.1 hypothetical protein [Vibrio vulnificus]